MTDKRHEFTEADLDAAKVAIRRGVPIGEYLPCTCTAAPIGPRDPRNCFGICLDAAEAVAMAIAKARQDAFDMGFRAAGGTVSAGKVWPK